MEATNRKHLSNMRVVQKNLVYVVGLSPKFAREEFIPTLKSADYFGQYGRVAKILISKRMSTHKFGNGHDPSIGVYVTYQNKEDAARAIVAIDGSKEPGGRIIRASYGTTKYCTAYLRNLPCSNPGCTYLHEPGEEADSFTKEDLATLRHAAKDTEHKIKPASMHLNPITKKVQAENAANQSDGGEGSALPRTALWASGKPVGPETVRDASAFPSLAAQKESPKAKPATPARATPTPKAKAATPAPESPRPAPKAAKDKARKDEPPQDEDEDEYVYKPSANAQRLIDDLHARRQDAREQPSVFPDFDWTLASFSDGDFSFHLPALPDVASSSMTSLTPAFASDVRIDEGDAPVYTPYQGSFNPFDTDVHEAATEYETPRMAPDALWRLQQQSARPRADLWPRRADEPERAPEEQRSAAAALLAARARQLQEATESPQHDARAKLGRQPGADSQSLLALLRRIQDQPGDERAAHAPPGLAEVRTPSRTPSRDGPASYTPPPPGLAPGAAQPNRATGLLLAQLLGTPGAKPDAYGPAPTST